MLATGPVTKSSERSVSKSRKPRTAKATRANPTSTPVSNSPTAKLPMAKSRLARRMLQDLQLAGHGERTQEAYLRAVRQLAAYTHLSPDQISEEQLRQYFLYLKNHKSFAPGSLKVAYNGIRFFYIHTVRRDWETLRNLRVPKQRKLPAVMSIAEVRQLIKAVETPHNQAFFVTTYSLGLRLQEALHLQVGDIDSRRMLVHV